MAYVFSPNSSNENMSSLTSGFLINLKAYNEGFLIKNSAIESSLYKLNVG